MTYWWLVENFTPEGQSTGLYMACQVNMTLTADVNAARRFRRQRTAEFRAADMREARRGDWRAVEHGFEDSKPPNCPKGDEPCIRGCKGWECRDGWPDGLALKMNDEAPSNAVHWHKVAMECRAEIDRLHVENAKLTKKAKHLQGLLDAVQQIAGELARPSGI